MIEYSSKIVMIFELFKKMYSWDLFTICISGYFFLELLLISPRTHPVRTAKSSLFNKNISLKYKYKRFREYINEKGGFLHELLKSDL